MTMCTDVSSAITTLEESGITVVESLNNFPQ